MIISPCDPKTCPATRAARQGASMSPPARPWKSSSRHPRPWKRLRAGAWAQLCACAAAALLTTGTERYSPAGQRQFVVRLTTSLAVEGMTCFLNWSRPPVVSCMLAVCLACVTCANVYYYLVSFSSATKVSGVYQFGCLRCHTGVVCPLCSPPERGQ